MNAPRSIRVLLVDDHTLVRAGIRALMEAIEGVRIVAEADNGRDAVALVRAHRPDVVVMDISMKELNGVEATERIAAEVPGARVLILSMHADEEFVRRAMKAGASGYIVKESAPFELRLAVEAILRGEIYLSSRVSRHVVAALVQARAAEGRSSMDLLTTRQREVLQLIAEGKGTKAIAAALGLSVKTVENHRAAVMLRLGIRDVAGLAIYAVRQGLVERPEE